MMSGMNRIYTFSNEKGGKNWWQLSINYKLKLQFGLRSLYWQFEKHIEGQP